MQALGDDYRLISFDLPGFGLTGAVPNADYSRAGMSQTVSDIIKLMKLKKVVMVGHSMGGRIAMRYAADYSSDGSRSNGSSVSKRKSRVSEKMEKARARAICAADRANFEIITYITGGEHNVEGRLAGRRD